MMYSRPCFLAFLATSVFTAALALTPTEVAYAAADVWDGNGVVPPNGAWGTGNNWADNTTPGNADTAGVGPDDYDRWKTHFGETSGSGAGSVSAGTSPSQAAVPEPSSVVVFLTVALAGLVRRPFRLINGPTKSKTVFAT